MKAVTEKKYISVRKKPSIFNAEVSEKEDSVGL